MVVLSLQAVISDLTLYEDGRRVTVDQLDAYQVQLEGIYRELTALQLLGELNGAAAIAIELVGEALTVVLRLLSEESRTAHSGCQVTLSSRGRPRFMIPADQLNYLLEKRFTVPQISELLGVSVRTIRRRMTDYNLNVHEQYSMLSDQELDEIVRGIQDQFPTCGN